MRVKQMLKWISDTIFKHDEKVESLIEKTILYGSLTLLIYMPFSMFLSRWLSLYTGGLGYWEYGKDILTLVLTALSVCYLFLNRNSFNLFKLNKLFTLCLVYALLHILFLVFENQNLRFIVQGNVYNLRIIGYLIIGIALSASNIISWTRVKKIALVCSAVVALLGLVQLSIPNRSFLENFGYTEERAARASFAIDDKEDLPRLTSTIREPNSLGAYLLLPVILIFTSKQMKKSKKRLLLAVLLPVLFFSFSRSAWIGITISLTVLYGNKIKSLVFNKKNIFIILGITFFTLVILLTSDKVKYYAQNIVLHSDESTTLDDPNEIRAKLYKTTIDKAIDKPFGYGPGSAGAVSIGRPEGSFITENYYLQVLIEVGVLGLLVFIGILWQLAKILFNSLNINSKPLLVSLFGYLLIGMFTHIWSNEAVAFQWWFLAGFIVVKSTDKATK